MKDFTYVFYSIRWLKYQLNTLQSLVDDLPKKAKLDKEQKEYLQTIELEAKKGQVAFERALKLFRDLIDELKE